MENSLALQQVRRGLLLAWLVFLVLLLLAAYPLIQPLLAQRAAPAGA